MARPQVAARFAGLTVERGSLEGRMSWTPWQDAQFATVAPERSASPWKLSTSRHGRAAGRIALQAARRRGSGRRSPWTPRRDDQGLARRGQDRVLAVAVGADRRVVDAAGAAWPWTLPAYTSAIAAWQVPQVAGTRQRGRSGVARRGWRGSRDSRSTRPPSLARATARPWTLSPYASTGCANGIRCSP